MTSGRCCGCCGENRQREKEREREGDYRVGSRNIVQERRLIESDSMLPLPFTQPDGVDRCCGSYFYVCMCAFLVFCPFSNISGRGKFVWEARLLKMNDNNLIQPTGRYEDHKRYKTALEY